VSVDQVRDTPEKGVVVIDEVVFVSEAGDFYYRSGRFNASWHSAVDGAVCEPGPKGVLLGEALSWANDRGDQVVVNTRPAIPTGVE
jgi:hypothetical protein